MIEKGRGFKVIGNILFLNLGAKYTDVWFIVIIKLYILHVYNLYAKKNLKI